MADNTLKKLIALIGPGNAQEMRRAAVLIASVVGPPRDGPLIKALLGALDEADPELRLKAIDALGRLQADAALPRLTGLAEQGGAEVEAAVQAASRLGGRGARAMEKLMAEAAAPLRRRIAAALAQSGTESAAVASAHALLDDDPGVVEAAARSLAGEVTSFGAGQRRAIADFLMRSLQTKKPAPTNTSEAAMLRVLAALHHPGVADVYWSRLERSHPPPLRAAALQALAAGTPPTAGPRLKKLLDCASAADFNIVAPALLLLQQLPAGKKHVACWQQLLDAPDVAARRLAVERLKDVPDEAVARSLIGQVRHPDRALREAALAALRGQAAGRQSLLDAVLEAETVEDAWPLARALAPSAGELSAAAQARLLTAARKHQEADDRRAEPLWFLAREVDPARTRDAIEERALALRKKKDYASALAYFRLLTRDPACAEEIRLEQALTALKLTPHDTLATARQGDPVLGQIARLIQNPAFDVSGRLAKAKWLDPEDLYYLGFHFVEQTHHAKEVGAKILAMVIERSPRSTLAKDARRKLKSAGLV